MSWPSGTPVSPMGRDDGADPTSTEPEPDAGRALRPQPLAQPAAGRPLSERSRRPRRADPTGHRSAGARSPPSPHRHRRQARRRHERLGLRPVGGNGLAPRPLRRWGLLRRAPRGRPSPECPQVTTASCCSKLRIPACFFATSGDEDCSDENGGKTPISAANGRLLKQAGRQLLGYTPSPTTGSSPAPINRFPMMFDWPRCLETDFFISKTQAALNFVH